MRCSLFCSVALTAVALTAAAAAAGPARANTFTMVSCTPGQLEPSPWDTATTAWMRASAGCTRGDGLSVWADIAGGPDLPSGSYAKWRLRVPGALVVRRIRGEILLGQGGGWSAGLFAEDRAAWLYGGPGCFWSCGSSAFAGFDLQGVDSRDLDLVTVCTVAVCHPAVSSALRNVEVTIEDPSPPQVSLTGGTMITGGWVRGDASLSYRATDDAGIQRTEIYLDGQRRDFRAERCVQNVLPGCPTDVEYPTTLSTRLFSGDGPHTVTVRATDFSGNAGESSVTVRADNTAPIAPLGLTNAGSDWQSTNDFTVRWSNPPQAAGAPIAGARWRLCPVDGPAERCVSGARDGAEAVEVDDLALPGPGRWRLQLALADAAGNADLANAAELTLGFDETPPEVAIVPSDPQDPTRLRVTATDDTSPIARGEVELHRHGSSAWRSVPTRVTDGGLEATIDDETLPAGDYDVRAHAWNAAGLERSSEAWSTGGNALLTLPLRIATRVRLGAVRKRKDARARAVLVRRPVLAYGHRVRLTGQLTAPGGNPLAGVPVEVSSLVDGLNTVWRPAAELRTDRSGHFRYLVPRGPSRVIRFRYPGTPTVRSITRDVPVRVRASSSITVSRHRIVNGDAVRFRGTIRGGHLPASKRVEMQYFARGKWRTFASTRATARGRWGYTYRFDGSRGVVTWRFRARITAETGYPYTTGHSGRVAVTVRGLP